MERVDPGCDRSIFDLGQVRSAQTVVLQVVEAGRDRVWRSSKLEIEENRE